MEKILIPVLILFVTVLILTSLLVISRNQYQQKIDYWQKNMREAEKTMETAEKLKGVTLDDEAVTKMIIASLYKLHEERVLGNRLKKDILHGYDLYFGLDVLSNTTSSSTIDQIAEIMLWDEWYKVESRMYRSVFLRTLAKKGQGKHCEDLKVFSEKVKEVNYRENRAKLRNLDEKDVMTAATTIVLRIEERIQKNNSFFTDISL